MKRTIYWIENDDNPLTLRRSQSNSDYVEIFYPLSGWQPSSVTKQFLDADYTLATGNYRRIPKREAKSLFPEAFISEFKQ